MGPETIAFEKELAQYINVPHLITVSSCTDALFLSLLVEGIKPGDEVICPSLTWCSTADVALHLGAKVVFCDVDPDTLCVTPELIKEKLTPQTKAVMVVHYGGLAIDMEKIREVLPDDVCIIEDAAHALGAKYPNGNLVGSSGNLTCFSFYANKNLSTAEGGAIALFDTDLAQRLKALRLHGISNDAWKRFKDAKSLIVSHFMELGYKMNYTDLQACIGRIQLKRQDEFYRTRLEIAEYYFNNLKNIKPSLKFQANILDEDHVRHLFIIQLPIEEISISRDEFVQKLRSLNIGASIHYRPLHDVKHYQCNTNLYHTEDIYQRILTLPISASMNLEEAEYIVKQVKNLMEEK